MQIKELTAFLETIAPPMYQESYDNAGLIVGDPRTEITGVLLCLDSTEDVIEEAKELSCNVVIAHHQSSLKASSVLWKKLCRTRSDQSYQK